MNANTVFQFSVALMYAWALPRFVENGGLETAEVIEREARRLPSLVPLPPDCPRGLLELGCEQIADYFQQFGQQVDQIVTVQDFTSAMRLLMDDFTVTPADVLAMKEGRC